MHFGSSDIPRGWVEAPEFVRNELELLWLEDEMPEELKQDPGYRPFTLSPDAQEWVDSMSEVRELSGKQPKVIGRPKPVTVKEHRIVAAPPPEPIPAPRPPRTSTPTPPPPPRDRPDYTRAEVEALYRRVEEPPPKPIPPRPMPAIGEPAPEWGSKRDSQVADQAEVAREKARPLPEIGEPGARVEGDVPQSEGAPRMPEVGGSRREPERSVQPAAGKMPEIGEGKVRPKRQAYDATRDEDDPILRLRGK